MDARVGGIAPSLLTPRCSFLTRRPERGGVGVLPVIVIVLMMIMALIGLAQRFLGSQVGHQTHRMALGKLAEHLAESAVEEGLHYLRSRANDPSSPLFMELRGEIYSGQTGSQALTIVVPHAEALAAEAPYEGFYLEDVRADIVRQGQFSDLPYEKYGLVRLRARASIRLGLTEKVTRTAEAAVDLKVALASTPRPYDQTTVYVMDGTSLDPGRVNLRMGQALRALEELRSERDTFQRRLEAERDRLDTGAAQADVLVERYRQVELPQLRAVLHEMPEDALILFRVQSLVPLEELDLPAAASRYEAALGGMEQRLASARRGLEAAFDSAGAHLSYLSALEGAADVHAGWLRWMVAFQNVTAEYGGESHAVLDVFRYKLELLEWKRKAFHIVRERAGESVNEQLLTLRNRLGRLSGVILVENPTQTLSLEGRLASLPGPAVLVATGQVRLVNTNRDGKAGDLLTVVAFGPVSVDGEVHASVVARDRALVPASARIVGNLILRDMSSPASLRGEVARDARYFSGRTRPGDPSGAFPSYYVAGVGPRLVYKQVER